MMYTESMLHTPERVELSGILSEFREALEDEIDQIKKNGLSSTQLLAGQQIESRGTDFWYRFRVEYAPSCPADTPCKLIIGNDQFDVTVVSVEENTIVVASKVRLPDAIGKAKLENGSTVLMERLIRCIEANADKDNPVGSRMLFSESDGIYAAKRVFEYHDLNTDSQNNSKQNDAVVSALSNDITYIWGPPGTGKTTVIGQIIDELRKRERSVLVVSHTNAAVDGAIEKADDTYSRSDQVDTGYPILRIGSPARSLPRRVLLEEHIAILGKDLYEKKASLEIRQTELQNRINVISVALVKDRWLKENDLDVIRRGLQILIALEKEIAEIQCRIDAIQGEIEREKAAHPEYADYRSLLETHIEKAKEYEEVCRQVESIEQDIAVLPQNIQTAQDEIRKHSKYAELQEKEATYMSATFLQGEIDKTVLQIDRLSKVIHDLTVQQTAAEEFLSDYEKKGWIKRAFVGKSELARAITTLDHIRNALPEAKENLRRQQALKGEYSQQLENLLLLQTQIRAVVPSETPAYWNDRVSELQADLSEAREKLPILTAQKVALCEEVGKLEGRLMDVKTYYDAFCDLDRQLHQEQEQLEETKESYEQGHSDCSARLEQEYSRCAAFLEKPTSESIFSSFEVLSKHFEAVKTEIEPIDIEALKAEKEDADQTMVEISRELNVLKQQIQELEKQAIMNAKVVGATLAKSYLSETLRQRKFDTVILDEASMASIPALWCVGYLAEKNIVIVGDFLQLPPIVVAKTPVAKKWLGQDIFYHSGMKECARNQPSCPENFIMLNDQFRMESDIASIANMYYGEYGGLRSNDNSEKRIMEREEFYRWYSGKRTKSNIHLIDTESLHAWATGVPQGKGHSRLNCFSAAVSVDLAFKCLENKLQDMVAETARPAEKASVLIVAPYKPHIKRIEQLVELEYSNRGFKENLNYIRVGTIHSLQGSEADIVIFDLVVDEPHWKANLFMTDKDVNDDLRKMFNVAITRARFKLYIVANFAYCQKRARNNALSELLDKLLHEDRLVKVDAKSLLPDIVITRQSDFTFEGNLTGKHIACREGSFDDYFKADLLSFKKRMIIFSPFMTEARLSILFPFFFDAVRAGKQIIVVTKEPSERGRSELAQTKKCEEGLRSIGVAIAHKKGMHEKLIFVDSDAVWIGSLNALSFTGMTGEVMVRYADREMIAMQEEQSNIQHICETIEHAYEQWCPICGGEMLIKESDEGGIYWQCIFGDYSRSPAQQYPRDGILRCKCGAPYVFSMKNEPRWVCSKEPRHYQKMRESDLKLEKMAALIPTKAMRRDVDRYFMQKKKTFEACKNPSAGKTATVAQKKSSQPQEDDFEQIKLF